MRHSKTSFGCRTLPIRTGLAGLLAGLLLSGCGSPARPAPTPTPAKSAKAVPVKEELGNETVFTGQVFRKNGDKLEPIAGAAVWTVPESDEVITDKDGLWTISAGLASRQYRVWASFEDQKGRTSAVQAKVNATVQNVNIVLGEDETPWPPTAAFVKMLPKGNKGPEQSRTGCCAR